MQAPTTERETSSTVTDGLIDTDIHNDLPSRETLLKYLPDRWRRHHDLVSGRSGRPGSSYPRSVTGNARTDSWPPSGLPPGSDLPFLREQLLDRYSIGCGILNPFVGIGGHQDLEYGAALARATNDWLIEEWLNPEPRLRASIVVQYEDGDLAAEEIERLGGHPGFVQVLVLSRTGEPLGRRKYWKIYEAAERHGLPIGIHFGGTSSGPITSAGWVSYYIEDHVGASQTMQAQLTSLVYEGIFERFPNLRVALIEGGFAWLPPLMWRLDRAWEKLHEEIPRVRRPPSEYIRERVRLTTQPMEEPTHPSHFLKVLEHLGSEDLLMFATDYPHWDFDAPNQAFPIRLPAVLQRKIMVENARAFYRLA